VREGLVERIRIERLEVALEREAEGDGGGRLGETGQRDRSGKQCGLEFHCRVLWAAIRPRLL
jgi:hypothetical protein